MQTLGHRLRSRGGLQERLRVLLGGKESSITLLGLISLCDQ